MPSDREPVPSTRPWIPRRFPLALILLLIFPGSLPDSGAASRGRVKGTVTDPSGTPLPGVTVKLSVVQGGRKALFITQTNSQGSYRFEQLRADTYGLEAGGGAYELQRMESIHVHPPFRNVIDFTLQPLESPAVPELSSPGGGGVRKVGGTLQDSNGRGIPDTRVLLQGPARAYRSLSEPDGSFLLDRIPPGIYRLEVRSPGFISVILPGVRVDPEWDLAIQLTLIEYPLDFQETVEDLLPPERPRPRTL